MNIITVKYYGDTFLPEILETEFKKANFRIIENRYEDDKIHLILANLRGEIIRFLAANGKMDKIK